MPVEHQPQPPEQRLTPAVNPIISVQGSNASLALVCFADQTITSSVICITIGPTTPCTLEVHAGTTAQAGCASLRMHSYLGFKNNAGFLSKKPTGANVNASLCTFIIGHSSGRGL